MISDRTNNSDIKKTLKTLDSAKADGFEKEAFVILAKSPEVQNDAPNLGLVPEKVYQIVEYRDYTTFTYKARLVQLRNPITDEIICYPLTQCYREWDTWYLNTISESEARRMIDEEKERKEKERKTQISFGLEGDQDHLERRVRKKVKARPAGISSDGYYKHSRIRD